MRRPRIFAATALSRLAPFSFLRRLVPQTGSDALDPSIYGFILHYSRREQIYLIVVTLLSFPFLYVSLQIPKYIIDTIAGKTSSKELFDLDISQVSYLLVLCGAFLAFILINGWFKLHINVKKGQVGERMLRRLRYELYERLLRFPLHHFDRTAPGATIAMMTGELEPVGGFVGEAFALPISQGGTLLTIFVFMFVQDPVLGAAAVAFYPLQGYLIPKLQRIIRRLGRERVQKVRRLSDRIGETIAARREIRANNGAPYQLADIANRLGEIYDIRFEIYNRKFFVKFLNNFIGSLTPFFFYAIGGYLVIKHELSIGALTAVIAALKDLSSPWKELLDFYQNQQDVAIKSSRSSNSSTSRICSINDCCSRGPSRSRVSTVKSPLPMSSWWMATVSTCSRRSISSFFSAPMSRSSAMATAAEIFSPNSSPGSSSRRVVG
jgi:putative ABC transport system ATP-binding protein